MQEVPGSSPGATILRLVAIPVGWRLRRHPRTLRSAFSKLAIDAVDVSFLEILRFPALVAATPKDHESRGGALARVPNDLGCPDGSTVVTFGQSPLQKPLTR